MKRARRLLQRILFFAIVAALIFYAAFPFYWAIATSLKGAAALTSTDLFPREPTLANYYALFGEQPFLRNILNSLIVAASTTVLSLGLSLTAAYALGRMTFRGRRGVLLTTLGVSMFPQIAVLSGMFELVRALGLYNSLMALVLSNLLLTLPFCAWMLTAFMRELPVELEEAATVDGARPLRILITIFLPIMAPGLVATGLLAFIVAWNEFLFALTFTLTPEQRTAPVAIALISGATAYETPWGRIMAASVIVTTPMALLALALQKRIVAGLTAGAVKA